MERAQVEREMKGRPTFLVVVDEDGIVELMRDFLEADGFRVLAARTGAETLATLARKQVEGVLPDLMLPDISGFEVLRRIRELTDVPVLILSARDGDSDKIRGLRLGGDDYVVKSATPDEVLARVHAILRPQTRCSRIIWKVAACAHDGKGVGILSAAITLARVPRHRRRQVAQRLRHPGRAPLVLCPVFALLLSACAQSTMASPPTPQPTRGATATTTATPAPTTTLPTFADWRVAYVDAHDYLHAVSLDGRADLSGLPLDGLNANGTGLSPLASRRIDVCWLLRAIPPLRLWMSYQVFLGCCRKADAHLEFMRASVMPNYKYLDESGITGRTTTDKLPSFAAIYNMFWSPDGSALEADDNAGNIMVEHLPDGKVTSLAKAAGQLGFRRAALGWIDATHLAVQFGPTSATVKELGLGSLDVTTGQVRTLATFSAPLSSSTLGTPHLSLAPDGTRALFYNQPYRADPFVPQVDAIDTASGAVTSLPNVTRIMGRDTFSSLAWRPGTHTVAASRGYKENNNLKTWLLDLVQDSATPMAVMDYPAGWAPDSGTLILTSGWQSLINEGPLQLTAVSFAANSTPTATVLIKDAYTFPFLGFVRTA